MPSLKITYVDLKGLAEPCRLALTIGGIDFEDERLNPEERAEQKKKGMFPFGAIPVLTVDGKHYAQSSAILRYCGKLSGLYPEDFEEAMLVDGVIDAMTDVVIAIFAGDSEEARKEFVEEKIPKFFAPIDRMIGETEGPFLLGEKMSIADLKLYVMAEALTSAYLSHVPKTVLDDYKNLNSCVKAVGENEKIASWNAAHT